MKAHQPMMRDIVLGRAFNMVMRMACHWDCHSGDTQCGFKLVLQRMRPARYIFSRQIEEGFSFDVEDLMIARALGLRSIEVPVEWSNVEGTKVDFSLGMKSFADLVRIRSRAVRGNYRFFVCFYPCAVQRQIRNSKTVDRHRNSVRLNRITLAAS